MNGAGMRAEAAEIRAKDAEARALQANKMTKQAISERDITREMVGKQKKIVETAQKIAGFSGHVGWPKYIKATEEMKKAVEEGQAAK